jgi:hypothetical protein
MRNDARDQMQRDYDNFRRQYGGRGVRTGGRGGGQRGPAPLTTGQLWLQSHQLPTPPTSAEVDPSVRGTAEDESLYPHGAQWYADMADPAAYYRRLGGWPEPILDHSPSMAPAGAPRFADANGMVRANGYNPMTGRLEAVNSYYPWGANQAGSSPSVQDMLDQRNWAMIPWQNSWADPSSPNFYMTAQGLGPPPADYFNRPPGGHGGYGHGMGPPGGPGHPGPQGPPPPYPSPGANGPTGPASNLGAPPPPPSGNWTAPATPGLDQIYGSTFGREGNPAYGWGAVPGQTAANNWTPPGGNQTMYPGMPYAGGMGPYSGWLPSVPNIPTDYTGQPPMGVDSSGYPIGGQVPGAPTGPGAAPAAATPANPFGPNSGWLPPAPGTQQDWGSSSPLQSALAQRGIYGTPIGQPDGTYINANNPSGAWG